MSKRRLDEKKLREIQMRNGNRGPGGRFGGLKEKPKDIKKTLKQLMKYIGYSKKLLIGLIIVALVDRMPVKSFITNFQNGVRKIYKLAFIYVLVNCVYVLFYYFPIGITILNALLGKGSFNVLSLFIVGFVGLFLAVDYELVGSALASYLAVLFAEKAAETTLVLYLGMSIAAFIVPTSYILMLALTYLDIPYTKWLKYIWKFLLTMVAAALIVILLVCVF